MSEAQQSNTMVVLATRPGETHATYTEAGEAIFALREAPVPPLGDGEVLLRNIYLSLDPYMASYMLSEHPLETPIEARVVAEVAASNSDALGEGDLVWGFFGWELFTTLPASLADRKGYSVVDNKMEPEDWPEGYPLSHAISILGMPGLTAYVGMVDIAQVKAGETVFVSSAAGALGQIAGQIGKLKGCRVVGSAGSDEKVAYVTSLGFDAAFNYKTAPNGIEAALRELCPEGIDVYFDNVGGETLDTALMCLNEGARVPLCGMISTYQTAEPYRLANLFMAIRKRATLTGFTIYDHFPHKMPAYRVQMVAWLAQGKVRYKDVIVEGIENTPAAFARMLAGEHGMGKCLVRVGPDPSLAT